MKTLHKLMFQEFLIRICRLHYHTICHFTLLKKMEKRKEPDIDNVLKILKDYYGYGDIGVGYFEEFEKSEIFKNVLSDTVFDMKIDFHINRFNLNSTED